LNTEEKILIKVGSNPNKTQKTYKIGDRYRKEWTSGYRVRHIGWLRCHLRYLKQIRPGYVLSTNTDMETFMWVEYKEVPGTPVRTLLKDKEFTKNLDMIEFLKTYKKFCVKNMSDTKPYVHMDWHADNILIDGDWKDLENWDMVDWDHVGLYPKQDAIKKLNADMEDEFGKEMEIK